MGPTNPGDSKLDYLNPGSSVVANGLLNITATKRSGDQYWNTGLVTTEGRSGAFELKPGDYWETRMKLPAKGGAWLSTWTWGRDLPSGVQPGHGEIDKVEYHTHNGDLLELNNHVRGAGKYYRDANAVKPGGWVTVGIKISTGSVDWYVNDKRVWADGKGVPSSWVGWPILELSISNGNYHPRPSNSDPIPVAFDWTRVYR